VAVNSAISLFQKTFCISLFFHYLWFSETDNMLFSIKIIFIFFASLFLGVGIIGIFIPGLPTTPFLLLSSALYVRSSKKLYYKVINNRLIGPYILAFQQNKCMSLKLKIYSIALMWIMIGVSAFLFISSIYLQLLVFSLGIIGSLVMGIIIKTCKK
jgi:uncharacterized membrane protein YbaN (DUF454 family)